MIEDYVEEEDDDSEDFSTEVAKINSKYAGDGSLGNRDT
jgi:hypothetical protein